MHDVSHSGRYYRETYKKAMRIAAWLFNRLLKI